MASNLNEPLSIDELRMMLDNAIEISDPNHYQRTIERVLHSILDRIKALEKDSHKPQNVMVHGIDCPKVEHERVTYYLHSPEDDTPFNMSGAVYCGRCHITL